MEQRSPEWFAARLGKVTASRIADVMARTKTGWGASRANYMAQLIAERLTGVAGDSYSNAAMQWGVDKEPEARAAYEFFLDADVVEVGFVDHPRIPNSGASPDGLVLNKNPAIVGEGLVEIKCPNTATHIDTLLSDVVPTKYIPQMQWQMACTDRAWCDFVSYDPRLPESMRLWVRRVERDDSAIAEMETHVKAFLAEVDSTVVSLQEMYG